MNDLDFLDLEVEENDMPDLFDLVVEPEVVSNRGRYGVAGPMGFVESPLPSLEEEMRRNPVAALENRRGRARTAEADGNPELAKQMRKEAREINKYLHTLAKWQVAEFRRALVRDEE